MQTNSRKLQESGRNEEIIQHGRTAFLNNIENKCNFHRVFLYAGAPSPFALLRAATPLCLKKHTHTHVRKCGYAKALIYTSLTHFYFVCMFKNITATFPAATFSQMPTCHKGGQHFSQPLSQQRLVCLSPSIWQMEHDGADARHALAKVL